MTAQAADPVKYTFLFLEQKAALMVQYLIETPGHFSIPITQH